MKTVLVANSKGGCGKTLVATTLAASMAGQGRRVALVDADRQKSSLGWLQARPDTVPTIVGIDWSRSKSIGTLGKAAKAIEWLVIDAPGGLRGERAELLIGMANTIVVPVMPSMFDAQATRRFLARLETTKSVRKGKAEVLLVVNRLPPRNRDRGEMDAFYQRVGLQPVARISDRIAYSRLAADGLSIFDTNVRGTAAIRSQWIPLLAAIHR